MSAGDSLEEIVEYSLLYDFYGALLKEKNRTIFEDYMFNDMTLAEVAEGRDITRQGVRDILNRAKLSLVEYEKKLGLISRFQKAGESAGRIKSELGGIRECMGELAAVCPDCGDILRKIDGYIDNISSITDDILDDF